MEGRLQIEVYDTSSHMVVDRVPVAPNGSFEFRSQPAGSSGFDIRVVNQRGDVIRQERFISQMANSAPLRLNLTTRTPQRPTGEIVSVGRLAHKPSKKAFRQYEKAEKATRERHLEEAVRFLEEAVRIDPQFMEAYNALGNRLLQLGQLQPAAEAFERAIEIDAADSRPYSNLAIVQMHLGRYAEAERTARHAAQLPHNSRHAEYLVGLSLVAQQKDLPEALSLLERSAGELPHAHMAAGQILLHQGHLKDAARHLELFLKIVPDSPNHRTVEKWMRSIRSRMQAAMAN